MVAIKLCSNLIILSTFLSWFCIVGQSFLFFTINLCIGYVISMDSRFSFSLNGLQSFTTIIYFGAQIVPDLASGSSFKLAPEDKTFCFLK